MDSFIAAWLWLFSVMPDMEIRLALKFGASQLMSRRIELDEEQDPVEAMYERGWSDGLPVVAPTDLRIARMLAVRAALPMRSSV